MKRLMFGIFCMLFCGGAHSAQIVNVEYIHKLIEQEHGITVPYNTDLHDPTVAANMKYLLTTIDAANSILNGEQITDYGNGEYATNVATDTVATLEMVRDHIRDYKFFATTTADTTSFSFSIGASGVFHIDWGDGTRESYRKDNTTTTTYSHEYADAGEYVIKIGGYRTGGSSISFANNKNLAKIEGSLGAIFSTIKKADGTVSNPSFQNLFSRCTNLSGTIPPDLFKGIYGQPSHNMFFDTFANCSGLTGPIPNNLFGNLYGQYRTHMFLASFYNCSGLTGQIPDNLFGDLYGPVYDYMFKETFANCSGLTGQIPDNLFGAITDVSKTAVFQATFSGCSGLTGSIPNGLFGNSSGTIGYATFDRTFTDCSGLTGFIPENLFGYSLEKISNYSFRQTFAGCKNLTGPSAKINGQYLYEIWPDATNAQVGSMYSGATGLTDYADIPSPWK